MTPQHLREQSSDALSTPRRVRKIFFEGGAASAVAAVLCALALATNDAGEWSFGGVFQTMSAIEHPGYIALIAFAVFCGGRVVKRWLDRI